MRGGSGPLGDPDPPSRLAARDERRADRPRRPRGAYRRRVPRSVALPLAVALLLVVAPQAGAGSWRAPLDGEVVGTFTFDREAPFERGARRGIDLAAPVGTVVRAACTGVVTFAGRSPAGRGVTVRCGRLAATHLGLGSLRVGREERVRAGAPLGLLAAPGVLRLGARRTGERHGYVDPARLLAPAPPALGPAPRSRPPASRPAPPVARPAPAARPTPPPRPGSAPSPPTLWIGLVLVSAGALGGAGTWQRRRTADGVATRPGALASRR